MKNKPAALAALAIAACIPHTATAAIVMVIDTQVTVNGNVPTAPNVTTSVYNDDETVGSVPSMVHYNTVVRLVDDSNGNAPVEITSLSSAVFSLGKTDTVGVFNINYGGTFSAAGGGLPQFSLQNNANADITSPEYGSPFIGNPFPIGTTSLSITNQEIPQGSTYGGGSWDPTATGKQTGRFTITANYAGGSVTGTDFSTVTLVPEPSATGLGLLGVLGLCVRRRRR